MEVKHGYKQTEVGVIPEEWEVEKISDLIEKQFIVGHLDGNHGELYPRSHEFKSYGIPYVGANDFEEGNVTFERCKFLSEERAAKFRKGVAKDGDVLFAHNATVGPVALLRTDFLFVILSTTATYFRCNPEKLSNSYLKGALQAQHFVRQYQAVMAQSTRFQVPITAQRKLSLVIAPFPEQRAIATALSDVDGLLGGLDWLIAKKRDLKQAAMQQLLTGQTRLPGFHGEWEVKRLGDVGKFLKGSGITKDQTRSGALACVRYGELYTLHNDIVKCFQSWISPEVAATAVRLKQGDILFAGSGETKEEIGKCAAFVSEIEAYAGGDIVILRPHGSDSRFLGYYLNTGSIAQQKASRGQGDAVVHISSSALADVRCKLPSPAEQTAIASVLADMDAELAALEQRREKTRALKQAMMQELLTGRTRLVARGDAENAEEKQ